MKFNFYLLNRCHNNVMKMITSPYNSLTKIIFIGSHQDFKVNTFLLQVEVKDNLLVFRKVPPPAPTCFSFSRKLYGKKSMRPQARGLAQHVGPPGWLEKIDPAGVILYVMDGPHRLHFQFRTGCLDRSCPAAADGISSCCYIVINVHSDP
jgi:hypothetical protein